MSLNAVDLIKRNLDREASSLVDSEEKRMIVIEQMLLELDLFCNEILRTNGKISTVYYDSFVSNLSRKYCDWQYGRNGKIETTAGSLGAAFMFLVGTEILKNIPEKKPFPKPKDWLQVIQDTIVVNICEKKHVAFDCTIHISDPNTYEMFQVKFTYDIKTNLSDLLKTVRAKRSEYSKQKKLKGK